MPSYGKDESEKWKPTVIDLRAISRKIPLTTGRSKQSQEGTLCRCTTAEPWICSSWQRWHGYQLLPRGDASKCTSHQISHVLAAPCMSPSEHSISLLYSSHQPSHAQFLKGRQLVNVSKDTLMNFVCPPHLPIRRQRRLREKKKKC